MNQLESGPAANMEGEMAATIITQEILATISRSTSKWNPRAFEPADFSDFESQKG
jgi:hypothetical protein